MLGSVSESLELLFVLSMVIIGLGLTYLFQKLTDHLTE